MFDIDENIKRKVTIEFYTKELEKAQKRRKELLDEIQDLENTKMKLDWIANMKEVDQINFDQKMLRYSLLSAQSEIIHCQSEIIKALTGEQHD